MSWQDKILSAAHGNRSRTGCILRAAFGCNTKLRPRFGTQAYVTSDGFILCDFVESNGEGHMGAFVGALADFKINVQALAQDAKLTAAERSALFLACGAWLGITVAWRI